MAGGSAGAPRASRKINKIWRTRRPASVVFACSPIVSKRRSSALPDTSSGEGCAAWFTQFPVFCRTAVFHPPPIASYGQSHAGALTFRRPILSQARSMRSCVVSPCSAPAPPRHDASWCIRDRTKESVREVLGTGMKIFEIFCLVRIDDPLTCNFYRLAVAGCCCARCSVFGRNS